MSLLHILPIRFTVVQLLTRNQKMSSIRGNLVHQSFKSAAGFLVLAYTVAGRLKEFDYAFPPQASFDLHFRFVLVLRSGRRASVPRCFEAKQKGNRSNFY
jgi:hypothetical protein